MTNLSRLFFIALFGLGVVALGACVGDVEGNSGTVGESLDDAKRLQVIYNHLMKRPEIAVPRVGVSHILVKVDANRNEAAAAKLVNEIWLKLEREPERWEELRKAHSEDNSPSAKAEYTLVDTGRFPNERQPSQADQANGVSLRSGMVTSFGDIGFRLNVDEIGLCVYDAPTNSPHGFHIIKRTK